MFEYLFVNAPVLSGIRKVISVNGERVGGRVPLMDYVIDLGRERWELIAIDNSDYIFKRKVQAP